MNIAKDNSEREVRSGSRPGAVDPFRILYAEDDRALGHLVMLFLRKSGYDVELVPDGGQAWSHLQHDHYDLLITDNDMPLLTGRDLIRRIRGSGSDLPILLTSGSIQCERNGKVEGIDCTAGLTKPFNPLELVTLVHQVLENSSQHVNRLEPAPPQSSLLAAGRSIQPWPHSGLNE